MEKLSNAVNQLRQSMMESPQTWANHIGRIAGDKNLESDDLSWLVDYASEHIATEKWGLHIPYPSKGYQWKKSPYNSVFASVVFSRNWKQPKLFQGNENGRLYDKDWERVAQALDLVSLEIYQQGLYDTVYPRREGVSFESRVLKIARNTKRLMIAFSFDNRGNTSCLLSPVLPTIQASSASEIHIVNREWGSRPALLGHDGYSLPSRHFAETFNQAEKIGLWGFRYDSLYSFLWTSDQQFKCPSGMLDKPLDIYMDVDKINKARISNLLANDNSFMRTHPDRDIRVTLFAPDMSKAGLRHIVNQASPRMQTDLPKGFDFRTQNASFQVRPLHERSLYMP